MRNLRRSSQLACLGLFLFLLVKTSYPLNEAYPVDIFPRLSPLLGLTASIASRTLLMVFWPALIVAVAAMVLGRSFCGWVCPMGTTLDICDKVLDRKRNAIEDDKPAHRRWKYGLLVFLLAGSILGLQMTGWFDPMSLVTRSYALALQPYANYLAEGLFNLLYLVPRLEPVLYPTEDFLREHILSFEQLVFSSHLLFALIFVGIVSLGTLNRRFWCRSLCPLGALMGLLGRYPALRRVVNDDCTNCLKCQRSCMTDAIVEKGEKTLRGECVYCFTCKDVCPEDAISFSFKPQKTQSVAGGVLSRRAFVGTSLAGSAALPMLKLNYQSKSLYPWVIRPPGVEDEKKFLAECLRCGECMKVCLKNALHPTIFDGGAEGMWTPKLVPRVGYCEFNCTLCGDTCPSNAIPELTVEEKHKAKIGMAYFDKNRCIPWVAYDRWSETGEWPKEFNCAVCEEHCPTSKKSIRFSDVTIETPDGPKLVRRPVIVDEECIGCGICEYTCPIDGLAGVRVVSKNAAKQADQSGTNLLSPTDPPDTSPADG
jgi:polyferredoxin